MQRQTKFTARYIATLVVSYQNRYIREEAPTVIPQPVPRPRTRLQRTIAEHRTTSSESSDESSDDSVDYFDVDYVLERTVDSEPTFTDEPAVDGTPSLRGEPRARNGTVSGSASDIDEDANPQEDTPVEQEEQPQEPDTSPVPVRRSGRDRKPPAWIFFWSLRHRSYWDYLCWSYYYHGTFEANS
ncbi:unnamed protein product [Mytilus coruscus]|uniref:Uncharacterized protein n=1 Tax=Mytilus coruscus TaxID=42192 RepID=A0A6J8D5U2_MYTCO|nr:unnamed protein product [Mytilus coruscus]